MIRKNNSYLFIFVVLGITSLHGMNNNGKQQILDVEKQKLPKTQRMIKSNNVVGGASQQASCCEISFMVAPAIFCGSVAMKFCISNDYSLSDIWEGGTTAGFAGLFAGKFCYDTYQNYMKKKN